MSVSVFDLHCDTAYSLLGSNFRQCGSLKSNSGHIDLDRAATLDAYAQCFACFTTKEHPGVSSTELFERELATINRELERNSNLIKQAYSAADIETNKSNGIMSAILTIEGPAGFGYDPELLYDLHLVGFRMSTLGWNESNPLTGSCVTGGGLTDLGRAYVRYAQELGMLIDVSHISDEAFWNILDITEAPIVASHSNSRSICNVKRNIDDAMFLEICKTGGICGINFYKEFLGKDTTIDTVCDHIFHFLELDPEGKHIALGGDLDGCDALPEDFNGIQDYPKLAIRLIERGLTEEMIENIFWNNALEVMKQCCT